MNEYQHQFLRNLTAHGVRYLIIGGQARSVHDGKETRDLDVWVDISEHNVPALERCLVAWKCRYPAHTLLEMVPPLLLRERVQIRFPDADGCLYLLSDYGLAEINMADGIDILTSIEGVDFGACYSRRAYFVIDGLQVPFVSSIDLNAVSPIKPH